MAPRVRRVGARGAPCHGLPRGGAGCREAELVNLSETWRRLLADFRPVAKAAAERTDGVPQFGANGFVQV